MRLRLINLISTISLTTSIKNVLIKNIYKPKTISQIEYVKNLNNENVSIVLGIGPAGCGKTLFACITAIEELKSKKIEKIVLTRPLVTVEEEEIGYLPGNLINKMEPWTKPILDILEENYSQDEIKRMLNNNIIEICPLGYMRGRTFKKSFIIADEMQNSTPNQMLMLTTRIGENSKMVITGDINQSDINKEKENGLEDLMERLKNKDITEIKMTKMNEEDIYRSSIVKKIIEIYKNI
jgi:phosphate starvation-inducible PhoH-like protein